MDSKNKIDVNKVTNSVLPTKDVDGLHDENAGRLSKGAINGETFIPCTARGCVEMIKETGSKVIILKVYLRSKFGMMGKGKNSF